MLLAPTQVPAQEQELKFHVPRHASRAFRQWLGVTFQPHRAHGVSTICSIYFDTPEAVSFMEKAGSDYHKTKYRVRWYADAQGVPLPVPAFIEIKEKHGATRCKHRRALPMSAQELMDMPFSHPVLADIFHRYHPAGAGAPPARLRPQVELRYVRQRFRHAVFPETFCLDSDIRTVRTHGSLPAARAQVLPHDVFEQKGAATDPVPLLQALPRFGARRASLSKFYLSVIQLFPHSQHA